MEQRKWNLIVFNVPESTSPETVQRKDDDINFICNVAKEINAGEVDVVEVVCLGVKVSDKLRPLKVQFRNLSHRRLMLVKAKKLRDSESAVMKNVYINPDLSVKERQVQRNLSKELTEGSKMGNLT